MSEANNTRMLTQEQRAILEKGYKDIEQNCRCRGKTFFNDRDYISRFGVYHTPHHTTATTQHSTTNILSLLGFLFVCLFVCVCFCLFAYSYYLQVFLTATSALLGTVAGAANIFPEKFKYKTHTIAFITLIATSVGTYAQVSNFDQRRNEAHEAATSYESLERFVLRLLQLLLLSLCHVVVIVGGGGGVVCSLCVC